MWQVFQMIRTPTRTRIRPPMGPAVTRTENDSPSRARGGNQGFRSNVEPLFVKVTALRRLVGDAVEAAAVESFEVRQGLAVGRAAAAAAAASPSQPGGVPPGL